MIFWFFNCSKPWFHRREFISFTRKDFLKESSHFIIIFNNFIVILLSLLKLALLFLCQMMEFILFNIFLFIFQFTFVIEFVIRKAFPNLFTYFRVFYNGTKPSDKICSSFGYFTYKINSRTSFLSELCNKLQTLRRNVVNIKLNDSLNKIRIFCKDLKSGPDVFLVFSRFQVFGNGYFFFKEKAYTFHNRYYCERWSPERF